MKRLCYLGILKEGFWAYFSPLMLTSGKVPRDKRVVTNFRHLNIRIAKNSIAYPLLKDTFSGLGSSRCKVLSVSSIFQSYINAILDCLQSRKYCKAIMDDQLLFTPTNKSHIAKLEDLLKALLKNGLRISPKKF